MSPNWPVALKDLAAIKAAVNMMRPDWNTALKIWEDQLDYAIPIALFQQIEPGQAPPMIDPRLAEVRMEAEGLHRALKAGDRKTVDALLISITGKVQALAARAVVA